MDSEVQIVRAILRQNEFFLRRHLVLSKTVLDQLKANNLITDVSRRKILLEPVHKQVPVLISSLENRGIQSLRKFMDVLKDTGHGWIVEQMLDTDVSLGGKRRTIDDISYRDHHQPGHTTRPQDRISDYFTDRRYRDTERRNRADTHREDNRKSLTSLGPQDHGLSLSSLLKLREPMEDPESVPRGVIHARTLLTDPIAKGYQPQPAILPEMQGWSPNYPQPSVMFPRSSEEIPLTLYGLNQVFSNHDQRNQQALSVLRQEEVAIKQLMEQNLRDQGNVRRKQAAVQDIVGRLKDIHNRAKEVYEPSPHPNIGRYRLAQLNQIPWSIDG